MPRRPILAALAALALAPAAPGTLTPGFPGGRAAAQESAWDGARALELVERARARRQEPVVDSSLQTYRADVTGHIYFFFDQEGRAEPVLLRADQVALELYWRQPDRVKQVIRGMRSEEQFPIKDFRYYLDRYTVIQNGFGDEIRVGEGRDVRDVPHPLASGAGAVYEYRLADSTTIQLPGEPEPIRVYEVQVRPRDFDVPAIVGSLFIERARGDLVRLTFTFTHSAYLDPRNDRVEIILENALWEGRYWLPREQRLLVRRELPELDLDVGTVIRAALRVTNYELNVDVPRGFFLGSPVIAAAGPEGLRSYEFEEGLYDGFEAVGLAPGSSPGTLDEVDVEAITGRILRQRYLRGASRGRLFAPTASHVLRYDRSEGLVTGAGLSAGVGASQLHGYGGYAWGSREPVAELGWGPAGPSGPEPRPRLRAEAYVNRPIDLGLRPAAAGAVSTLAAAAFGQDFRDGHPVSGAALGVTLGMPRTGRWAVTAAWEDVDVAEQAERAAPPGDDLVFRPVPAVEPGRRLVLRLGHERSFGLAGAAASLRPAVEIGHWEAEAPVDGVASGGDGAFGRVVLELTADWTDGNRERGARVGVTGAAAVGARPPQHLWYLGGRNTVPGHPFHAFVGDRAAVADITLWKDVVPRLVRVRLLAGAGWATLDRPAWPTGGSGDVDLESWAPGPTDGVAVGAGVGVGVVDGLLRLDWAVPFDGGRGALMLSVDPRLWSFL